MRAVTRDTQDHSPFDKIEERIVDGRPGHPGNRDGCEHKCRIVGFSPERQRIRLWPMSLIGPSRK